jgi:hypothetical protein
MATAITHADTRREMGAMFSALAALIQAVQLKRDGLVSVGGGETQIAMTHRDLARLGEDLRFGEGVLEGADLVYLPVAAAQAAAGGEREVASERAHNQ